MAQVITQAIRTGARQRIAGLEQREKRLSEIEATARSPAALRRGFIGKAGLLQKEILRGKIGERREIIAPLKTELTRISKLPTQKEWAIKVKEIIRQATSRGTRGHPLKSALEGLSGEERAIAKQAWKHGKATDKQFKLRAFRREEIIEAAEKQAGMTFIPSERQRIGYEGLAKLTALGPKGGDFSVMTAGGEVSFTTLADLGDIPSMSNGRTAQQKFMDLITTKDKMSKIDLPHYFQPPKDVDVVSQRRFLFGGDNPYITFPTISDEYKKRMEGRYEKGMEHAERIVEAGKGIFLPAIEAYEKGGLLQNWKESSVKDVDLTKVIPIGAGVLGLIGQEGAAAGETLAEVGIQLGLPEETKLTVPFGERKGETVTTRGLLSGSGEFGAEMTTFGAGKLFSGGLFMARGLEDIKKEGIGWGSGADIAVGLAQFTSWGKAGIRAATKPSISVIGEPKIFTPTQATEKTWILGTGKTTGKPIAYTEYTLKTVIEPAKATVRYPLDKFFKKIPGSPAALRATERITLGKRMIALEKVRGIQIGDTFIGLGARGRTTRRGIWEETFGWKFDKSGRLTGGELGAKQKFLGRRSPIQKFEMVSKSATEKVPFSELSLTEKKVLAEGFYQKTGRYPSQEILKKQYGEQFYKRDIPEEVIDAYGSKFKRKVKWEPLGKTDELLVRRGAAELKLIDVPKGKKIGKKIERGEFLEIKTKKITKKEQPAEVSFFETEAVAFDRTMPTGYVTPGKVQTILGKTKITDLRGFMKRRTQTWGGFKGETRILGEKGQRQLLQRRIAAKEAAKDIVNMRRISFETQVPKTLKQVKKLKAKAAKQLRKEIVKIETKAPSILDVKPSPSFYTGKGMYERTEGGIMPPLGTTRGLTPENVFQVDAEAAVKKVSFGDLGAGETRALTLSLIKPATFGALTDRVGITEISKERQKQEQQQKQIQKEMQEQLPKERSIIRERQLERQRERLKSSQGLKLTQAAKQGWASGQRQPPREPAREPPRRKLLPVPKFEAIAKKVKGIKEKGKQAFEVQVRREGQFKTIGKGLPKGKALKMGAKVTKTTLAATFRIVPKGKTTQKDIMFKPSAKVYRKPKRKVTHYPTFVEKRGFRLSTGSEISQIKTAKRRKRR